MSEDLRIVLEIDEKEKYDAVISNGVFPYFLDYEYAKKVLNKMYENLSKLS